MSALQKRNPAGGPGFGRGFQDGTGGAPENHSTIKRRAAPYSKAIIAAQRAGRYPNVYLFAGTDCWNQAEHRRRTHGEGSVLVLPPGEPPESYRWPALDALVAIPGDCPGERFRRLVRCLLAAGCRCIVEVRPGQAPACHYASADDARRVAA